MKVLIIGQGGREHCIAWKIAQSLKVTQVFVAPGNAGTALENKVTNINLQANDLEGLLKFSQDNSIDLTIVGPELPLVLGIVDLFKNHNLNILGPNKAAAQLEGSKAFCKKILTQANVPTAEYNEFTEPNLALDYISSHKPPYVIKADGLAAGKGVSIVDNQAEATDIINNMLSGNAFGDAGKTIIIEQFLTGQEASFIALISNNIIIPMASSQDHKARDDNDEGPNTGGMGAYSPAPIVTSELANEVINKVFKPTITTLKKHNIDYNGFLFAGLMIDKNNKFNVLEFNCRLGDPETQAILPRLNSDFFDLCYFAATNQLHNIEKLNVRWTNQAAVTIVAASKNYPGTPIKDEEISGLDLTNAPSFKDNLTKVFHAATYLDNDKILRTNGGRVLALTSLDNSLKLAQSRAYEKIKSIQWPSLFYRKDIAGKGLNEITLHQD